MSAAEPACPLSLVSVGALDGFSMPRQAGSSHCHRRANSLFTLPQESKKSARFSPPCSDLGHPGYASAHIQDYKVPYFVQKASRGLIRYTRTWLKEGRGVGMGGAEGGRFHARAHTPAPSPTPSTRVRRVGVACAGVGSRFSGIWHCPASRRVAEFRTFKDHFINFL